GSPIDTIRGAPFSPLMSYLFPFSYGYACSTQSLAKSFGSTRTRNCWKPIAPSASNAGRMFGQCSNGQQPQYTITFDERGIACAHFFRSSKPSGLTAGPWYTAPGTCAPSKSTRTPLQTTTGLAAPFASASSLARSAGLTV